MHGGEDTVLGLDEAAQHKQIAGRKELAGGDALEAFREVGITGEGSGAASSAMGSDASADATSEAATQAALRIARTNTAVSCICATALNAYPRCSHSL